MKLDPESSPYKQPVKRRWLVKDGALSFLLQVCGWLRIQVQDSCQFMVGRKNLQAFTWRAVPLGVQVNHKPCLGPPSLCSGQAQWLSGAPCLGPDPQRDVGHCPWQQVMLTRGYTHGCCSWSVGTGANGGEAGQTDRVQPVKGLECHAQVLNCFKSRGWEMRPQGRRAPQAYSNTGPPHRFINTAPASPVASPLVEHRCLVAKW